MTGDIWQSTLRVDCIKKGSSYESGNQAGSVTRTNFVVCCYGKVPRNKTKLGEHKLVTFTAVTAFWTPVTLLLKLFCIPLKWKYKTKIKAIRLIPVTWAGVFIWENFHLGFQDLGNLASPASHVNTLKFLGRKEWQGKITETKPAQLTRLTWGP